MPDTPNLLLIMTDQQRWDAMSCSGDWVATPNIDALAAEGVRFTNAVTTSPVCVPARLTMATGLYPHSTGVWNNLTHDIDADTPTWMRAVRDAGYRTSLFGKTHLHRHSGDLRDREDLMHAIGLDDVNEIGGPRASARVGSHMTDAWKEAGYLEKYRDDFADRFGNKPHVVRPSVLPLELYADTYVGESARAYLKAYDRDEPWCCWVSFGGPHEPWDTPEPYAGRYDPAKMPAPAVKPDGIKERPRGKLDDMIEKGVKNLTDEDIRACRADYAGKVALIDDQIGRMVETIKKRGEWENTVVVFTSDHGEMNGDAGLLYKSNFLNGAVRVPMIVRTPATVQKGGATCEEPVEWFDAGPTLVECAGGSIAYQQFARSLCPLVEDPAATLRGDALSELENEAMLLTREWKIAVNKQGRCYLLFDVKNDPGETRNLAGRDGYHEIEERLRTRLLERILSSQATK